MRSTVYPRCSAAAMAKMRISDGTANCASNCFSLRAFISLGTKPKPSQPLSAYTMRSALLIAASNLRSMAITSPTDFMALPI